MALSDYQFTLRSLLMGVGSAVSLVEVTGLDAPDVDLVVSQRSATHGAYTTGTYTKERVVTLTGRCNADLATLPTLNQSVKIAFKPSPTDLMLTFRLPGFIEQFVYVKPQSLRYSYKGVEATVGFTDFIASVVAGDPRIYSLTQRSTTFLAAGSSGGVGFPRSFPFAFSVAQLSGLNVAVNGGDEYAPTVTTFTGPLTNPGLVNSTTGASFRVLVTLGVGDVLVVDSLAGTILLNGTTSRYSGLTTSSVLVDLAPGSNTIYSTADAGSGSTTVVWRDTWM